MLLEVLVASLIVMLAALGAAVAFIRSVGGAMERHLGILISFTAGLFLFVSFELGREAIDHSSTIGEGFLWIVVGAVGIWLLFKLIPHSHEHEAGDSAPRRIDVRTILTGNGIHNIGDGVLLAAAFSVDLRLGIATAISVFVHELVQETSIFFVLRRAGYRMGTAILINFTVSGTVLIGAVGGVVLIELFHALEAPLLGISAGAFLVVVLQDLIPHSVHESRNDRRYLSHIFAFALGLILMLSVGLVVPHDHDALHDHDDHEHDHEHDHDDEHSGEHGHSEEHNDHSDGHDHNDERHDHLDDRHNDDERSDHHHDHTDETHSSRSERQPH